MSLVDNVVVFGEDEIEKESCLDFRGSELLWFVAFILLSLKLSTFFKTSSKALYLKRVLEQHTV